MKTKTLFGLSLAVVCACLATSAQAVTLFSDDFESYADTTAMNAVWANGGSATLDAGLGNPGQSMFHPGTSAAFSGGNTNSVNVGPVTPVSGQVLTYTADIYDDGSSSNKRTSAGLRHASPAENLIEMGMYNGGSHYAYRTILFGAPNGGTNWQGFSSLVDDSGAPISNAPVAGWHRFSVDITDTTANFSLDLNSDGNINATASVPITITANGFDIIRLGGPSDLSSAGGGVNFDNVSLSLVPEPAALALACCGLIGLAARRRR